MSSIFFIQNRNEQKLNIYCQPPSNTISVCHLLTNSQSSNPFTSNPRRIFQPQNVNTVNAVNMNAFAIQPQSQTYAVYHRQNPLIHCNTTTPVSVSVSAMPHNGYQHINHIPHRLYNYRTPIAPTLSTVSTVSTALTPSRLPITHCLHHSDRNPNINMCNRRIVPARTQSAYLNRNPYNELDQTSNHVVKHINNINVTSNDNYNIQDNYPNYTKESTQHVIKTQCNNTGNVPIVNMSGLMPMHMMKNDTCSQLEAAHVNIRYKCDQCHKTFKRKTNLSSHLKVHTDYAYICPYCKKKFARSGNLIQHIRVHTNEKPFSCKYCKKSFRQRHTLLDHERIHTGERPFQCKYCFKQFAAKCNLRTHLRTHTGEKPYECHHCDKAYASKSGYNSHMKRHHRESLESS
mmetsp:Transcript_15909/g.14281  ORF Transcript_15909/g.14281 Transcript_15909/m.14281 type:complete len:403 (-) Transcript_15909:160-1368(-)